MRDRYSPPVMVKWTVYLLLGSFSDNILKPALLGWKQKILHEMIEYWLSDLYMPFFLESFPIMRSENCGGSWGGGNKKKLFFHRRSDPETAVAQGKTLGKDDGQQPERQGHCKPSSPTRDTNPLRKGGNTVRRTGRLNAACMTIMAPARAERLSSVSSGRGLS